MSDEKWLEDTISEIAFKKEASDKIAEYLRNRDALKILNDLKFSEDESGNKYTYINPSDVEKITNEIKADRDKIAEMEREIKELKLSKCFREKIYNENAELKALLLEAVPWVEEIRDERGDRSTGWDETSLWLEKLKEMGVKG